MWFFKQPGNMIAWIVLFTFVFSRPGVASICSCVPENLCPAQNVDLRLVGGKEDCQLGTVCCDVTVNASPVENNANVDLFCDGECIPENTQCASDGYDDYGTGLIDVRLISDSACPAGYTCCRTPPEAAPVCSGTCVPRTLCTMFEMGKQPDGCTGENVCCSMNRESWMELITGINGMELDHSSSVRPQEGRCRWRSNADGAVSIPSWLVSIWARVEVIPGLTSDQFICAGALVGAKHVLALASCVQDSTVNDLFLNVGDYDLTSRSSLRVENIYSIQEKTIHEQYNWTYPLHYNVALLRLAGEVRNGHCIATLPSTLDDLHQTGKCRIIGWNREHLTLKKVGLPQRYETRVASFDEDLFCSPGTICLEPDHQKECDGSSLEGSPVVCARDSTSAAGSWVLKGLLVSNCTGISLDGLAAWVTHQHTPGFVQEQKPADPSRAYLPSL